MGVTSTIIKETTCSSKEDAVRSLAGRKKKRKKTHQIQQPIFTALEGKKKKYILSDHRELV